MDVCRLKLHCAFGCVPLHLPVRLQKAQLIYKCNVKHARNWFRFFSAKLEKILEDRAELEASNTILGRMLVSLVDEGVLDPTATNECAPACMLLHSGNPAATHPL